MEPREILLEAKVDLGTPDPQFIEWLTSAGVSDFAIGALTELVPCVHSKLEFGEYTCGYLWKPSTIIFNQSSFDQGLFPIGSLPSGTYIVVDVESDPVLLVGYVEPFDVERIEEERERPVTRDFIYWTQLAYPDWIIRSHCDPKLPLEWTIRGPATGQR